MAKGKRVEAEQESLPGVESARDVVVEKAAMEYAVLREEATAAGAARNAAKAKLVTLMEERGHTEGYKRGKVCIYYETSSDVKVWIASGDGGSDGEA